MIRRNSVNIQAVASPTGTVAAHQIKILPTTFLSNPFAFLVCNSAFCSVVGSYAYLSYKEVSGLRIVSASVVRVSSIVWSFLGKFLGPPWFSLV